MSLVGINDPFVVSFVACPMLWLQQRTCLLRACTCVT